MSCEKQRHSACGPKLRTFRARHNLPPLADRFRVVVAPGIPNPEATVARSRALARWMIECWRKDRQDSLTSNSATQSRKLTYSPASADLN